MGTEKEKIGHLVRFGLALKKIPLTEIRKWSDYQIENGKNEDKNQNIDYHTEGIPSIQPEDY